MNFKGGNQILKNPPLRCLRMCCTHDSSSNNLIKSPITDGSFDTRQTASSLTMNIRRTFPEFLCCLSLNKNDGIIQL